MRTSRTLLPAIALLAGAALAVETKTWVQSESAEFEKGAAKKLALSSDGRITLAPAFTEAFDPAQPQLWSAASAPNGAVYAAGSGGRIFLIDTSGKGRLFSEIPGGEIYAMAVRGSDLYAAVSPDAKIYRVTPDGKSTLFATLDARYVWALVFDPSGDLFAATGDQGRIVRVTPAGRTSLFFDTGETHARSLVLDSAGNLIAGTDPGGLVLRVSPQGEGFVLFQTPKREVTALLAGPGGVVYAAATGIKQPPAAAAPPVPPVPVAPPPAATSGPSPSRALVPPPTFQPSPAVTGGSDIYRIPAADAPTRLWSNAQQIVYALAFDPQGKVLLGTGNQGRIYRIDSDNVSTRLADSESSQITAFASGPRGAIYAATANVGKLFRLGPETEKQGTLESDLLDAGGFTEWGRLRTEADLNGGAVTLETRSGNLDHPHKNWSPWAAPTAAGRVVSPPARFLGWRATLTAAPGGASPTLTLVEAAYRARNVAPAIEKIEITPANYKFPTSSLALTPSTSTAITLPAMGQPKRSQPGAPSTDGGGTQSMNYDKGHIGARWRASDPNGDTLSYKLEIRGAAEREWKPLKDHLRENRFSFDSTAFADGHYRLRVTATDLPDNVESEALTANLESAPFLIDNTPPVITGLTARVEGAKIRVQWSAADALSPLSTAEYSLNGADWKFAIPTTRLTDSLEHSYSLELNKPPASEFTITIRVSDDNDNQCVRTLSSATER